MKSPRRRRAPTAAACDPRSAASALPPRAGIRVLLARPAVAIVGARACSPYGAQVARTLGRELAAAGLLVVSGLARGMDGEAHRGALEAGRPDGRSARVRDRPRLSGCACLPRACDRRALAVRFRVSSPVSSPLRGGSPLATASSPGCARRPIVVEARERSGALITADFALEEGREVFAVPGEITSSLSAGTNALLASRRNAADDCGRRVSRRSGSSRSPSALKQTRCSSSCPRRQTSSCARQARQPPRWPRL